MRRRVRLRSATFRFYAELIDLLAVEHDRGRVRVEFDLPAGVKDLIEACGVPHTEVDLILASGESVGFDYRVEQGDRISVYPMFEAFDIGPILRVRPQPLRVIRFLADNHLSRLARYLRLLGFDTIHDPALDDPDLVQLAVSQHRILLTRDRELLKHGSLTHGYYVRSTDPRSQVVEVARRFHLEERLEPFSRCMVCNGELIPAASNPLEELPDHAELFCPSCRRTYWQGSHHQALTEIVQSVRRYREGGSAYRGEESRQSRRRCGSR